MARTLPSSTMRTLLFSLVSLVSIGCGDPSSRTERPAEPDQSNQSILRFADLNVNRVWTYMTATMGTEDAWKRSRYFTFDFVVDLDEGEFRRSHEWDRYEGQARVAWTREGTETVALLDGMNPHVGRVWVDGAALEPGPVLDSLLDQAYRAHINDSYWLVMPFKWTDPGVHLTWIGRENSEDGRTFEVVELTFDGVGVTPQNKYRAYVNTETWLMERWAHYPTHESDPSITDWTDYRDVGPLVLSLTKGRIHFENLRVVQGDVPQGAFLPPST